MSDWTGGSMINGKQVSGEEHEEVLRREELAQEHIRGRAEELAQRLAETYTELTKLMRENPGLRREAQTPDEVRQQAIYQKLRTNLQHAKLSPRCRWVKQDGTCCGSPQMKKHIYCYAHIQMMEARTLMLRLPAQEDANAIQIGLMQVQKALIEDRISTKKAGLLFYSLQLAMTNVGQTTFGKAKDEEMITEGVNEMDGLAEQMAMPEPVRSRDMPGLKEFENRIARPRTEGLPRMNGNERKTEDGNAAARKEMQRAVQEPAMVGPGSSQRQSGMNWDQVG